MSCLFSEKKIKVLSDSVVINALNMFFFFVFFFTEHKADLSHMFKMHYTCDIDCDQVTVGDHAHWTW